MIRSSTATTSSSRPRSGSRASQSRSVGRNHPVGIAFSALLFAYIERATQVLALQNIPQEISKIMQGSIILSAVIAYEIVRRVRVAAEVRDAAAKAQPRAAVGGAGGAIPEPVPA